MDNELRQLAFNILRKLSNRIGHLPESYLLSDKFDVSDQIVASGGFADIRMGVFKGKNVAVKTLRLSSRDDKAKIRRVRKQTTLLCRVAHTSYSTSVKKSPRGRTYPIRTSSISLEFLTLLTKGGSPWSLNGWPTVTSWSMFAKTPTITFSSYVTAAYPSPPTEILPVSGRRRRANIPSQG